MSSHEIKIREEVALDRPVDLLQIIMQVASDPRFDVEKMERLLAMQERVQAEQKKTAYMAAMARLQAKLPQINKEGLAKNSKFAKLEDIDAVIRPLLAEEGFSFSFDEEQRGENVITFIGIISHREGHSETRRLTVPMDSAASNREGKAIRPAIQDAGSTCSYARRYLIKMMLNIIERDEDTDGEKRKRITEDQARDLLAAVDEVGMDRAKFCVYMHVGDVSEILEADLRKALTVIQAKRNENAAKKT